MAVNVNTVYQRVLAIINKEQRGYLTPQEFNTIANQAQLDIFEQYFYDLNQFGRIPGNQTDYADMLEILEEKISIFEKVQISVSGGTTLPADLYRLGSILTNCPSCREAEQLTQKEWLYILKSPIAQPSNEFPIFIRDNAGIKVYGDVSASTGLATQITSGVYINYVKVPTTVEWAANSSTGLYNSATSVNFELHESEETELVIKILALAGVIIRDNNVYAVASGEDTKNVQQEKA
jgi:hypothetical protein|tara:strand:- start:238 stop:945 length:708 start_codon:yes stop_codon:yes gene_type:complete